MGCCVDPTWGVSQLYRSKRQGASLFTLRQYEYDESRLTDPTRAAFITPYDRCKANLRCNWGIVGTFAPPPPHCTS